MGDFVKESKVRLEADAQTVGSLVGRVKGGLVRIPTFQRALKWDSRNVLDLYDSVYKGYPIGALLMRKGPAKAAKLELGPLRIRAPETPEAFWVVDGQQRLVALTAGLARPSPVPVTPEDPYVVYFDTNKKTFEAPSKNGEVPSTWIPATELLDASELSEWIFDWEHGRETGLRMAAFDAGKRLREYRIPQYVVTTDDEELLREIFYRINNSGASLEWTEVHDALFGHTGSTPSTLEELADDLAALGMGRPAKKQMLPCVVAYQGLDVTRSLDEHYEKRPEALKKGVQEALPAIRHVFSFLRDYAEIPHLRLLPRSTPLAVLTRFFGLFPNPAPRTLQLLTRWTWRTLLGASTLDERTLLRRGVTAVEEGSESEAVQILLKQVESEKPDAYSLPDRFDARSSESRLALLGMASLSPRSLEDGSKLDVAALIEANDLDAFRRVWYSGTSREASSPANRIFLPRTGSARSELARYVRRGPRPEVLASHGIDSAAAEALIKDDAAKFVRTRTLVIESAVQDLGQRLAAWGRSDRPSIRNLLNRGTAA